jgi:hypothetical protein
VFEKRVLRRIFGQKRDEVTGDWRKLHNEELHNLYYPPNIIRMIKSRRMRWALPVVRMWANRNAYRDWSGSQKERDHYKDQDVSGCIILKWLLERWNGVVWAGSIWFRIGNIGGGFL